MPNLLSVGQAAKQLEVSPSTVRNWVEKGYIHAFRLPSGVRRIPSQEIARLVNDYFSLAPPVEGEDEPSLVLDSADDGAVWSPPIDLDSTDSSDQPSPAQTEPDQAIAL